MSVTPIFKFPPVIRNIEAHEFFESFIIFSVVSILGIRIFLSLTHYPQLGAGQLHIAHLLWGGLCMTIALLLFFLFLNKTIHHIAAIFAGIGFGTFIDELGKFITTDNNYFYQPTIAIIYSILVLFYLLLVVIRSQTNYTSVEYRVNALEATKEALINDFDVEEKRKALQWLSHVNPKDRFTQILSQVINQEAPIDVSNSIFVKFRTLVLTAYRQLVAKQWVRKVGVIFFVIQTLSYLALMTLLVVYHQTVRGIFVELRLGFFGWGLLISSLIAMTLVVIGLLLLLQTSRYQAYRLFRLSLLFNVLLVTFFVFYFNQLAAVINFIISYTFLQTFKAAQIQEMKLEKTLTFSYSARESKTAA